jgi:predicted metal-dependent peptidase
MRKNISAKVVEEEFVDPHKKKQSLQTGIYDVTKKAPFLGSVLQCLDIEYSHLVPRAGIMFDVDGKKWRMYINPHWYCEMLTQKNRAAILLHEIYHVTHKHPMRAPFLKINEHRRSLMNIGMDMAINQYIKDLPNGCQQCPPVEEQFKGAQCENKKCPGGCIDIKDYFSHDDKGNKVPWEPLKPMEYYYHKLIERYSELNDGDGPGEGEGEGGTPSEFDSHAWDGSAEESEIMDATEELVKRAMQKRGLTHDKLPGHIKDLLQDIDSRRNELNYRALILSAIKKHASGFDRESSWTRKSRRFGNKAPGRRNGPQPYLDNYIDSSGSISIQEANDFLDIIDNFLKVGARKCDINLWHTNVYHSAKYKLGDRIEKDQWQSGGTCLNDTLRKIYEKQPDLAIILTDGCYSDVNVESWMKPGEHFPQIIWIISRDGYEEHPIKRLGVTIKIPNTDSYGSDKRLEQQ